MQNVCVFSISCSKKIVYFKKNTHTSNFIVCSKQNLVTRDPRDKFMIQFSLMQRSIQRKAFSKKNCNNNNEKINDLHEKNYSK